MAQTSISGQTSITGATGTEPLQPIAQLGDFVALLPINWADSHMCDPPGGVYDVDITLGTLTIAGLQTAVNVWGAGADQWYRIKIPAGTNLHGSSYNSDGALMTMPIKAGATKCLVIESTTPNTAMQMVCSHGLSISSNTRNPGCTNDIAKMWTLTADSTPSSGNDGMFFPFGSNHIAIQDGEFTIAKGAYQSQSGVKVNVIVDMDGDHLVFHRNYVHGYNPGDSGQPAGACAGWNRTGTVTTNGTAVTWVTGDRFGKDFSDGTHSTGYPAVTSGGANHLTINGVNYGIATHDPASSDTTLTLATSAGVQAAVAFSMTNAATAYANGCGDDMRGIQANGDYISIEWNYFEKIHWNSNESHAISIGFSNGPVKIAHNWVEPGSGGIFAGGGPVDQRGGPFSDVEIRGNYVGRDLAWRDLSASAGKSPHPPFGCGPLVLPASNNTCPFNWAIKNLLELKVGHRVLLDGNILENNWADGQSGYAILITPRACSGGSTCGIYDTTGLPVTAIDNFRLSNNWIRNSPQGVQMSTRSLAPGDGGGLSQPNTNVDYINILFSNINDDAQFGGVGPDLIQWNASGQTYLATVTRTGPVAHAVAAPMKIANYDPGTSNAGTYKNAIDVSSVIRSGTTVTMKFNTLRHDPTVGGQVVVATATGWNGTFTITDVFNTNVNTRCTLDRHNNPVAAAVASEPQPCVRNDGTFGEAITYTDAQGASGTLCSSLPTCNALNAGAGIQVTVDTLSYKVTDISVGDGVYVHNCSDTSFNAGSAAFVPALSPTNPAGLDVYYAISPLAGASSTCQIENSQGLPKNATFQFNTVLSPDFLSIGSNGLPGQHYNNRFYHNVFATTSGGSNDILISASAGTEGTAAMASWDPLTFNFYDNVLQGRNSAQWSVIPVAAAANSFPLTASGIVTGMTMPTSSCPASGAPFNCPLMAQPYSSNFSLSNVVQLPQGVNLTTLQDSLTRTIYICPTGASCGTTGPSQD